MGKYLINPVKAFQQVKDNYILYVETAFGTRFEAFNQLRKDLLNRDRVFYREPWIELLPQYKSSGLRIRDLGNAELPGMNPDQQTVFKDFIRRGLMDYDDDAGFEGIYSHQQKMLEEALAGNNCVITSGTGSGKTESFLLPMIAQIIKELAGWPAAGQPSPGINNWWRANQNYTPARVTTPVTDANGQVTGYQLNLAVSQRAHETRPAAVRALILYPMNALVEDQMTRLRQALDADEVQQYLNDNYGRNRIYFGRYNASTPVAGKLSKENSAGSIERNQYKIDELKLSLREVEENMEMVEAHLREHAELNRKEVQAIFQRLYGKTTGGVTSLTAEMRSRFDMQVAPPDILITNYSMLGIMLMREIDDPVFEKTKQWLEEDPSHVFHLIIDELHLYRGTPGTEVAGLVRILINRLGLTPDSDQLRILASSASLDDSDEDAKDFLKEFFGITTDRKKLKIIKGESDLHEQFTGPSHLPANPFIRLRELFEHDPLGFENKTPEADQACTESAIELAAAFGLELNGTNGFEKLCRLLNHYQLGLASRFNHAFKFIKENSAGLQIEESRAIALFEKADDRDVLHRYFSSALFGDVPGLRQATEGLIIARGLFDVFNNEPFGKTKLQRFRFHYFFRNIEGLWATASQPAPGMPTGNLHGSAKITDETAQNRRVFELLYCESCGTVFYGGKKLRRNPALAGNLFGGTSLELVATSPKIEGLPEQSVQVLVERRSYADFGIFWPLGHVEDYQSYDTSLDRPENRHHRAFGDRNASGNHNWYWSQASLNMYSGDIVMEHDAANQSPENFIKGYLFQVPDLDTDQNQELAKNFQALPCACPHCATDRYWSTKRKSPIRGFRAGFSKTSQIFAKELFYQLPEGKGKRKLVSFSDSREDAAAIANGIERNHYQDLLRDEMIKFGQDTGRKARFLQMIEAGVNVPDPSDVRGQRLMREVRSLKHRASDEDEDYAQPFKAQLEMIARGLVAFQDFYQSATHETAPVIKAIYKLGINPAGCDWEDQSFPLGNGVYQDWSKCFMPNGNWSDQANAQFRDSLRVKIQSNLGNMLFGRLFYGLESSGFGWTTVDHTDHLINEKLAEFQLNGLIPSEVFKQLVDSSIRILAEAYRRTLTGERPDEKPYADLQTRHRLKKYVRSAAHFYNVTNADTLGEAITGYLQAKGHRGLYIQTERLFINFTGPDSPVYECNKCKKVHLHPSGGICTFCFTNARQEFPLAPNRNAGNIWQTNYLAASLVQHRDPVKLHCEELTGQTDDQFERQRHFRDYIFEQREGPANIRSIDLLSVTTTLEVGVDIGSLQAVMLANMPPQRFNYQQRVGRGGRRGQAYSVILTLCRGRSHDEFFFANPHRITGDAPPTPFLSTGQEEIVKRMLVKEVLRMAFTGLESTGGTHGEFGSRNRWTNQCRADIADWLNQNHSLVDNVILVLNDGDTAKLDFYRNYIHQELLAEIDAAVENQDIAAVELSETLAEAGLLPMFGMPSRVRVLYSGLSYNKHTNKVDSDLSQIDRPLDVAVTEFFPGAQKTKDKKIITAIGFTPSGLEYAKRGYGNQEAWNIQMQPGEPFTLRRQLVNCTTCRSYFRTFRVGDPAIALLNNECPHCFDSLDGKIIEIRTPSAFRTNFSPGQNIDDDTQIQISRPSMFAEAQNELEPVIVKNAAVSLVELDMTWRINEQEVTGHLCQTVNSFPFSRTARLSDQWIAASEMGAQQNGGYTFNAYQNGSPLEKIKIAANKITNVFRIQPQQVAQGLNLNPFGDYRGNPSSLGVKAAYYSAAFILQRALAEKQDVDPTEIEIADIVAARTVDGKPVAQIILADELANGSGFVKDLFRNLDTGYNYFEKILHPASGTYFDTIFQESHRTSCKDACYECLKVYRNMPYHGLIDWRLGIGLLRLLESETTMFGLNREPLPLEMQDWMAIATEIRDSFMTSFFANNGMPLDDVLPGIYVNHPQQPYSIFFLHPFWQRDAGRNRLLGEAVALAGPMQYKVIDTFNALRRPGWCYENISQL